MSQLVNPTWLGSNHPSVFFRGVLRVGFVQPTIPEVKAGMGMGWVGERVYDVGAFLVDKSVFCCYSLIIFGILCEFRY